MVLRFGTSFGFVSISDILGKFLQWHNRCWRVIDITSLVQVWKAIVEIYVVGILQRKLQFWSVVCWLPSTKTLILLIWEGFHVIPMLRVISMLVLNTGSLTLSGFKCLS